MKASVNANGPSRRLTVAAETRVALIVGAGIGGLAAGIALQRAGWRIQIHERADTARELGFALSLAPNAMAALQELGLDHVIHARGMRPTRFEIRRPDGGVLRRLDAQLGGQSFVALRSVLHGALLSAVDPQALRLSSEAARFTLDETGVTLYFADGRSERGDVLVGADGVRSVIRRCLHPDEPPPAKSRFAALRGVAQGVSDPLGALAAILYLGDGIEAAAARADSDTIYWYMSLLGDALPARVRDPAALAEHCVQRFEPTFKTLVSSTRSDSLRFDELFQHAPLSNWGRGRITLLGDAAHPLLPHTGQGAAQALEDAVALGLAVSRTTDVEQGLRDYERVRSRRTRRFITMGPRIARMTTTTSPLVQTLRTTLVRWIPEILLAAASSAGPDPHRDLR